MARRATRKKTSASEIKAETGIVTAVTPKPSAIAGGPLGVAMEGGVKALREDLERAEEQLKAYETSNSELVKKGLLLLLLDPSNVIDEVKTDRTEELGSAEQFEDLRLDIKERGQRTPIRVRPLDDSWTPDPKSPHFSEAQFVLQSGRRRLEVCKLLGMHVIAIVTAVTPEEDTRLDDLVERYSENTLRADLSGWEQYLSVGEIAHHLDGRTDREVADVVLLKREEVSVGRAVYTYKDDLIEMVGDDITSYSKRKIRPLISKVKKWIAAGKPDLNTKIAESEKVTARKEKGRVLLSNGVQVSASKSGSLKIQNSDGSKASVDQIEWVLSAITQGAPKVKN